MKIFSVALAVCAVVSVSYGQPPVIGCRKVLDIVLVVDGSDSISEPDFEKVKSSIAMLINQLDVEIDKIWFGLVLYSSDITEVVTLQQNKQKLLHRISLLKHARMGTNTALGIQTMDAMLGFGRPGVPKMGVVITDGISLDVAATHAAAVAAIKSGVSMFSVGIGNLINYGELQGIATGPGFVLNFTDFDQMSLDVIGRVASEICPNLCGNCTMVNGAGYTSHPTDCEKFVHCRYNHYGYLVGEIQQCAFSTYWNRDLLTCVPYDEAICNNDKCSGLPDLTLFAAKTNCRGYWECMDGQAMPKCCPVGYIFDLSRGCVEDVDELCKARCFNDVSEKQDCDKREVSGNPYKYEQFVEGWGYMPMPCAPGTIFTQDMCMCADATKIIILGRECKPEVYLPFDTNTKDKSGNKFFVRNENVFVENGVAKFTGKSRLIIPRFTNIEHSTTVVIKIKFTSGGTDPKVARAIVSNSDCGNVASILISEDDSYIYFGVGTSSKSFQLTSLPREQTPDGPVAKQELTYVFDEGVLTASNGVNTTSIDAPGTLKNVMCALHVGDADDLDNFVGTIDELSVYLCNPNKP